MKLFLSIDFSLDSTLAKGLMDISPEILHLLSEHCTQQTVYNNYNQILVIIISPQAWLSVLTSLSDLLEKVLCLSVMDWQLLQGVYLLSS